MMSHEVLDLCSSSDDDKIPTKRTTALKRTACFARQPPMSVDLLTDEEDDLDRKPAAKRRNAAGSGAPPDQEIVDLVTDAPLQDRKPAAKAKVPPQPDAKEMAELPQVIFVPRPKKPITPLERVLEVFPAVDNNHAQKLLGECNNSIETVLSILADQSYPRNKDYVATASSAGSYATASVVVVKTTNVEPKYDYMSASSFEPSYTYRREAVSQLLYEFPFVRIDAMNSLYHETNNHYSIVRNRLLDVLKGISTTQARKAATSDREEELKQFLSFKEAWTTKWPNLEQRTSLGLHKCLVRAKRRAKPPITDPILVEEVQHAQFQLDEWTAALETRLKRQEARKSSERKGHGVECACCFTKVPIEEMVACREEGHLFCGECIQDYANTAIFSNGSLGVVKATGKQSCELMCCDSSGCQSPFHHGHLQKALSVKILDKYNELQFRANCEAAGLSEEICTCPKCGFQADLPPNLIVFQCPVVGCNYESCRKCGKEQHIPLQCDEVVQKNREDEGRLKVEEAMAEAKIRKCPKCKTSIIKSEGCNKMTCRCGAKMCYICRKHLTGDNPYTHFCQTPHCQHKTCSSCTLYSNAEEDDKRAMREAGLAAAQSYRDEVKEKDGAGATDINIDVDGIMNTGVARAPERLTRRAQRIVAQPAVVQPDALIAQAQRQIEMLRQAMPPLDVPIRRNPRARVRRR